ncbi:complex I subunit 5 family protein [Methanocalculus sp.]|uniref:complex I subunit 5 family protein n=1 Tax=Methanocalculus sp. TaxID=2004547 RepID=UPI0027213FD9|nr:complex I subunit 5 family protein [Methanocalculus sp.]MDO8841680.1 complex I subunit 5 family protein [Methanocalculus sp.]
MVIDNVGIQPAYLLLAPIAIPLIGAFLCYLIGHYSARLRNLIAVSITALTLGVVGIFIPHLISDLTLQVSFEHAYLFYTPVLGLNPLSYTVLLVSIFVWMLATVYCTSYLPEESRTNRFYFFWLFSLSADLGVLLSGDFITLYAFFELLTLSAFVLINHEQKRESMAAAKKYLFLGIFGGFLILGGIALLNNAVGSIAVAPVNGLTEPLALLIAGCMILGFGVKAGMYPVHIWLPDAHSVAPTPASAVLSGVMIKIGAYGIFITALFILFPTGLSELAASLSGLAVIWIGLITMISAVFLALMQTNSKRMLAYHSISQMGFIILGIGCALYLGEGGALGFAGGLFHLVNHALFKALLFLSVGAVFLRTQELDMYRLGGLWKAMPATAAAMAIGVLAISGIPGFNGFVSKALIHHALLDAQHIGGWALLPAEAIFIIACAGTVASTGKLILFTFTGERKTPISKTGRTPLPMKAGMAGLSVAIILLGILPGLGIFFILPATAMMPFNGQDIAYLFGYLGFGGGAVYTPYSVSIAFIEVIAGVALFFAYVTYGWFHWEQKIPKPISPDVWYSRGTGALLSASHLIGVDLLTKIQQATLVCDSSFRNWYTAFSMKHQKRVAYLSSFEAEILIITLVLGMYLVIFLIGQNAG